MAERKQCPPLGGSSATEWEGGSASRAMLPLEGSGISVFLFLKVDAFVKVRLTPT